MCPRLVGLGLPGSRIGRSDHHDLEVEDGGAVDRLEGVDMDGGGGFDVDDGDAMKADWVRSIGRSGCEDSGEGDPFVVHRMGLQDAAVGLMQPGHHDQLCAGGDPMKRRCELRFDFEGGWRCARKGLTWRVAHITKRGSDQSDRLDLDRVQHRAKCR